MFSRNLLRSTTGALRGVPLRAGNMKMAAPRFSTLLQGKELADETRYIREQETRRREELKAQLDQVLLSEDSEHKQKIIGLLGQKPAPEGIIEKLGLDDWKFAVPVGLLVAIPAFYNELIIIDAELQLTASFILFASVLYTKAGPMIDKTFEDYRKEKETELNATNAAFYAQIANAQNANNSVLNMEEDLKTLHSVTDQVAIAQAEVLNQLEEVKYREAIIKKLESLSALEEAASNAIRNRIVTQVKSDVLKTLKTDKKVQESALNQAISILSAGTGAKLGKDVVGEVFTNSIKTYKDNYAKQPAGSDEILKQLEKDVAAVASAPEVQGKGGNVYETHAL